MDVSLFQFSLPEELIAQSPTADRSHSRLMILHRYTGEILHTRFSAIVDQLQKGDVLVLNDSRVRPARLIGMKKDTGAKIELLLLNPYSDNRWEALVKPAKRVKVGTQIEFGNGELVAIAEEATDVGGGRKFHLQYEGQNFDELLERLGKMPLPPYIHKQLQDPERYQTVFSRAIGSVAAPTAGLHFTESILDQIREKGVQIAFLTLHVGIGTFRPVTVDQVEEHEMHAEYYELTEENARKIKQADRVIAVGTTSVRTLETIAARNDGEIVASRGWTDIFIYPGFSFRVVDGLITNFHLPQSTLLMLVSAFSNRERILAAYQEAIDKRYRFFSFGDAMMIYS